MMTNERVESAVRDFIKDSPRMNESPIVVAVSGGADSMVLLHIMYKLLRERKHILHVVHINHGLRDSAYRDEQLVVQTCQAWGLPVHVRHVNLQSVAESDRHGLEADARKLRYDAIALVAESLCASSVCLAHHADDQLETVLWRLTRGTSLSGLSGIRAHSYRLGIAWHRPMLSVSKQEILTYAQNHEIPYCEDESNTDIRYTRNFIRMEVVPKLKQLQPNVVKAVSESVLHMQDEDEFLDKLAKEVVDKSCERIANGYFIHIADFQDAPRPLQRRAIKIILYCLASGDFSHEHIEACVRLAHAIHPSGIAHLPMGLRASRSYDKMYIGPKACATAQPSTSEFSYRWDLYDGGKFHLNVDGATAIWTFQCRNWHPSEGVRAESLYQLRIPAVSSVDLRNADTSVRMELLGGTGSKKIQDVFTDRKVPRSDRPSWPLFYVLGEPVWLPGVMRGRPALLLDHAVKGWVITATTSHT